MMKIKTDKYLKVNAEKITEHLKTYKDDDVILLTIEKKRDSRSFLQNNYYWKLLEIIERENGTDRNELHRDFGNMYLKVFRLNKMSGKEEQFIVSTTKLNTKQFAQYIEKIRLFAQDFLNIYLPTPEEYRLGDDLEDVFPFITR